MKNGVIIHGRTARDRKILFSAISVAMTLLAGCGGADDDKATTSHASSTRDPAPTQGQTRTDSSSTTNQATPGETSPTRPSLEPGLAPALAPTWTSGSNNTSTEEPTPVQPENGSIPGETIDGEPAPYVLPNLTESDEPALPVVDDSAPNTADTQEVFVTEPASTSDGTGVSTNDSSAEQSDTTSANVTSPKPQQAAPKFVRPNPSGFRWNSVLGKQVYGPGVFIQTTLANTIVGVYKGVENVVVNRFRALEGGELSKARLYWQGGAGYAAGTGGKIRLTVLPDNNTAQHLPDFSAQPLAEATFTPDMSRSKSIFPEISFTSKTPLQKGRIYHLVLQNIDPRPDLNYVSSNNAATHVSIARPSRWISNTDWGTLMGKRSPGSNTFTRWMNLSQDGSGNHFFSPILQLTFANGKSMGVSDMESGSVDPNRIYTVKSGSPARERFTPSERKRVNAISIATAASKPGQLKWRLLNGDREIAWGYIKASNANYRVVPVKKVSLGALKWYDIIFPSDQYVQLDKGQTYDLEFSAEGGSEWKFADHRNGDGKGFTWPAAFTESQAQHLYGGRWIDTNHWNHASPKHGSNWPVVLHLTR